MIRWTIKALFLSVVLGTPVLVSAAEIDLFPAEAPCHTCAEGCPCAPVCKRCVPVPDVMKVTNPVYSCKELDFCLPNRSLRDLFRGHCGNCCSCGGCAGCGQACECPPCTCPQCECRVRAKHVLLKKLVTVECPTFKCEAVCTPAPSCATEAFEVPEEQQQKPKPPVAPSATCPRPGLRAVR